jgi:hypothetical protein
VDFDRTKHLSDKSIKKRRIEREKLEQLEREREEKVRKEREEEEQRIENEKYVQYSTEVCTVQKYVQCIILINRNICHLRKKARTSHGAVIYIDLMRNPPV